MDQRKPSPKAKEALVDELRDAVGDEAVERADLDVDSAVRDTSEGTTPEASRSKLLFVVIGMAGVVVALIIALVLESWWLLIPLLAVHAVGTAIVVRTSFKTTTNVEKPAPTTQALLEDEGVDDPEAALNNLVDQTAERDEDSRAERAVAKPQEETEATDDPAGDVARQQESFTPGSRTRRDS